MAERKTLARPYAKAIFSLAKTGQSFKQWADWLQLLVMILADEHAQQLIKNQTISASNKIKFILAIAGDKIQIQEKNLLTILAQNSRLSLLPEIASIFKDLQQEAEQKISVTVNAAHKLHELEEKKLLAVLTNKFNKIIELAWVENKQLLAGVKLKAQDNVIDCSVYGQLEELRKVLEG